MYGYLRGANLKPGTQAHLAGVGDMTVSQPSSPWCICSLCGLHQTYSMHSAGVHHPCMGLV